MTLITKSYTFAGRSRIQAIPIQSKTIEPLIHTKCCVYWSAVKRCYGILFYAGIFVPGDRPRIYGYYHTAIIPPCPYLEYLRCGSCFNFNLLFSSLLGNSELWVNRFGVAICICLARENREGLIFVAFA